MEVLSKEDTLAAIAEATKPLLKELTILRKLVLENGEWVNSEKAKEMTGFSDNRQLKKYLTYDQKGTGGKLRFSKSSIIEYLEKNAIAA